MNPTPLEYELMVARLNANRKRQVAPSEVITRGEGEDRESRVRKQITDWCAVQHFPWVPMGARTDKPSTLPLGAQDLTIFGPFPMCVLVDTKSRTGKPSPEQRVWATRLLALGWTVHFIKTMPEFLKLVDKP